jgi:uncharacterized protein (UPF0276 family)
VFDVVLAGGLIGSGRHQQGCKSKKCHVWMAPSWQGLFRTSSVDDAGGPLLIDSHDTSATNRVWELYADVISSTGRIASLVEWDNDVPDWLVLRQEAAVAQAILDGAAHASRLEQ